MKNPVFFTTTLHLPSWPGMANEFGETIEKMHHFCHEMYNVPITWIAGWGAMMKYKERLAEFCTEYGDEVGIMEYGVFPKNLVGDRAAELQGWVEEYGLERPEAINSSVPEHFFASVNWDDMEPEKQKKYIAAVKDSFEKELGMPVKTFATPFINAGTIRAYREIGIESVWAHNWDYFCEGINNKGAPFFPFYPSAENHNIPEPDKNKKRNLPLAIHWGPFSTSFLNIQTMSRCAAAWCLNASEMVSRSIGTDQHDFDIKVISQMAAQSEYNPFVHIPLQLEADWMDEGGDAGFGTRSRCAEQFYREVEICLRLGAIPLTQAAFARWHNDNIGDTAEIIHYCEDPLPDVRGRGKDMEYQPAVVYADKNVQYFFTKARGFNFFKRYDYEKCIADGDDHGEMPFDTEPRVYLKTKTGICIKTGVHISMDSAVYRISGFELTAYHDDPKYAAVIWEANIPSYVADGDITAGGCVTDFRTLRSNNTVFLKAALKEGNNNMVFESNLPNKYIHVVKTKRVGKRYEVWIQNDNAPVAVCSLHVNLEPGLAIGGFWWDGFYYRDLANFDYSWYNPHNGDIYIGAVYPKSFLLNSGFTRVSFQLY
ncbi:MAG: hypothetical protein FWD23_11485 [Oscillospiraceae bacterium]|nr:hypothetical protein [Oscillospiraceae bacterium]